jgi:hypothetical protein
MFGERQGGLWPVEIETMSHQGSDSFKRNTTRIAHLRHYLEKAGILAKGSRDEFDFMIGAIESTCAIILMHAAVVNAYRFLKRYYDAEAAGLTAVKAAEGPTGWAAIAFAAGVAASVAGSFEAGAFAGRGMKWEHDVTIPAKWSTPGGREQVSSGLRAYNPYGRQVGD